MGKAGRISSWTLLLGMGLMLFSCSGQEGEDSSSKDDKSQQQQVQKEKQEGEERSNMKDQGPSEPADALTKRMDSLNQKIVNNPDDPDLYLKRSHVYRKMGDLDQAVDDMENALSIDSSQVDFHYYLGVAYYQQHELEKAKKRFEKSISLDPDYAMAYQKIGEIYLILRQYEHALEFADKSLKRDKYNAEPYYLKGFIFKELGDTSRAVSSFQTAVERNPDYYEAYILLGLLHADMDDDLAIEYYNTAHRIRPKSTEPLYNKGKYCQDHGMYNEALRSYQSLIDIDSAHINAWYNMGFVNLEYLKNYEDAIEYFDKAVKIEPRYYQAWYNRGLCYEMMGDLDQAEADYRQALDLKGNFDKAARGVNRLKEKRKNS